MRPSHETNLASPVEVCCLLRDLGLRPKRSLGQNFLVDRNTLNILLSTASVSSEDHVLEIGPGLGIVTEELADRACSVTAVEKDGRLAVHLRRRFQGDANVSILEADMLDVDAAQLAMGPVDKVVSNLPYCVGSRILVDLARMERPPLRMVVTVQKEVADRLAAGPGTREYGLLSVWCGLAYEVKTVRIVPPTCFWPRPEVSSAIVSMAIRSPVDLPGTARTVFYKVTRQTFSQRRKQMATMLPRFFPSAVRDRAACATLLEEIGLQATVRPQDLSVPDWCRLARRLASVPEKSTMDGTREAQEGGQNPS
jgi:16S rRNA (adenine1518-N6/adenine1519-N6)-dimethyltransferase